MNPDPTLLADHAEFLRGQSANADFAEDRGRFGAIAALLDQSALQTSAEDVCAPLKAEIERLTLENSELGALKAEIERLTQENADHAARWAARPQFDPGDGVEKHPVAALEGVEANVTIIKARQADPA